MRRALYSAKAIIGLVRIRANRASGAGLINGRNIHPGVPSNSSGGTTNASKRCCVICAVNDRASSSSSSGPVSVSRSTVSAAANAPTCPVVTRLPLRRTAAMYAAASAITPIGTLGCSKGPKVSSRLRGGGRAQKVRQNDHQGDNDKRSQRQQRPKDRRVSPMVELEMHVKHHNEREFCPR